MNVSARLRGRIVRAALIAVLIASTLLSLGVGHYAMPLPEVFSVLWGTATGTLDARGQLSQSLLFQVRLPRIVLAMLVGAALSASGASYQGILKNPLVAPDILGVSNGASLGAVIAIFFGLGSIATQGLAFAFGLLTVFLVVVASKSIGRGNGTIIVMILCGVVMSSLFSAFVSLLTYLADSDTQLPEITYWIMGSFARTSSPQSIAVLFLIFCIGSIPLLCVRWRINALSFGDEEASSMGVNVRRVRGVIVCCATLLTSASVSYCGVVGWVGLIIPHMVRLLSGPDYQSLLPNAMIGGAAFMVLVDICARACPTELPLSVVTAIIGAPLFLWVLFKGRKDWL